MRDRDEITGSTVNLGMFSNIILSVIKTVIGIIGHSQALLADGVNSTSDVVYYIAVKIFLKQARKPADPEHPYGHRQLESISAIVVGSFILTTGIAIFWESINKVFDIFSKNDKAYQTPLIVLFIAIGTLLLKIFLFTNANGSFHKTGNPTLRALANDHLNDIMAAIAVIIGVVMARFGFLWMDPAAGALVAIFIIRTGVSIISESSSELMDSVPDDDFRKVVQHVALAVDGVLHVDALGLHKFGPYFTLDVTICVDGNISVETGNRIAHCVEDKLMETFPGSLRSVLIHFHPESEHKQSPTPSP
jgi:cation diffusion facilitator family transporter